MKYEARFTPPSRRALKSALPESVAAAVLEFIIGALSDNPHRLGKPLTGDLTGKRSARRGSYRVIYWIDEQERAIYIMRISHRNSAYRQS